MQTLGQQNMVLRWNTSRIIKDQGYLLPLSDKRKGNETMGKKGLILILVILCLTLLPMSLFAESDAVVLPGALTVVEESAFEGDAAIGTLVIPAAVQEIGSRAFADCIKLTKVTFESMDTVIAKDAFDGSSVSFEAYQGSSAEAYALSHGIPLTLLSNNGTFGDLALSLVMERGKPESGLMGEVLASERLLVQMNGDTLPNISDYEPVRILSEGTGFYVIQLNSIAKASECYDFLKQREGRDVVFVEPDAFVTVNYSGDDEVIAASLNDKWSDSDPMGLEAYSEYIQNKYPNASATVAVIDSGVAYHSALNNHILAGYDFTGQNNPRYDANNHGTSVAGTIVDAVYGANVKIIPIRVFGGSFQTTLMIRQAVQQAINCHPNVINISSVFDESAAVKSLLSHAGCPVVVSAGNENANCDALFPAGMNGVITVSSIDTNMTKAAHSNYGSSVDFCAPGTNIAGYTSSGGSYSDFAGTSYAAPQISAAIALLSMDPEHSVSDLRKIKNNKIENCFDLGTLGKDQYYGYGLPNMRMFVNKVVRIDITNELPSVMEVGSTSVLTYEVIPETAEDKTVTISASDPSVLFVSKTADGVIRIVGMKKGTANVTITANDGSGVSATTHDITVVQPVTRLSIYASTNQVNVAKEGETLGLNAIVLPSDASNRDVNWSSENEDIATVAQNGVVTPVNVGTTIIRAEAADGYGAYDEFEIEVVRLIPPDTISIVKESAVVNVDGTMNLGIETDPEEAVKDVTWYSTDKNTATISTDGTVRGEKPGRVYIVATSVIDQTVQDSCELIISQPPLDLVLTAEEGATHILDAGSSMQLFATVLPTNADDTSVTWDSNNKDVATVDENGRVYGVSSGEAVISVKANGKPDLIREYPVTVRLLPVSITIQGDDFVYPNTEKQLRAIVLSADADDTSVTWSSDNKSAVTVTNDGKIRGVAEGVAVITARCNAVPDLSATITINVYPEWTYYDWTTADMVPDNAIVTDRKWTYTENCSTTESSLSGWTLVGSEWKQTGTGSKEYASFPSTYKTSHATYTELNGSAYTGYDNGATKRVVSNAHGGWVYWHWAYDVEYANNTDRWISDREQWAGPKRSLPNYHYQYFYAFKSTTNAPALTGFTYVWSANKEYNSGAKTYNCAKCLPSGANTSSTSGLATPRFLRLEYFTSTYTDYTKYYNYTRNMTVTTKPAASSTITNITEYVKYKVPNSNGIQLSGWVMENNVPANAEVVETRWTYKETITNNSASMSGWNLENSEWRQSGTGSVRWANFSPISGFDHSNSLYTTFNKTAPTAYENETAKRVITSTANDGYIYWHWMYSVNANAYDRAIFYKKATGSSTLTGNNYAYKYFGAFESSKAYPQMAANTNWGQDDTYYLWYKVSDRTSYADSQGSYYWYRTQIKKTSYTDYVKQFTYSRTITTTTQPTASSTVSNIKKYVRYIIKK